MRGGDVGYLAERKRCRRRHRDPLVGAGGETRLGLDGPLPAVPLCEGEHSGRHREDGDHGRPGLAERPAADLPGGNRHHQAPAARGQPVAEPGRERQRAERQQSGAYQREDRRDDEDGIRAERPVQAGRDRAGRPDQLPHRPGGERDHREVGSGVGGRGDRTLTAAAGPLSDRRWRAAQPRQPDDGDAASGDRGGGEPDRPGQAGRQVAGEQGCQFRPEQRSGNRRRSGHDDGVDQAAASDLGP